MIPIKNAKAKIYKINKNRQTATKSKTLIAETDVFVEINNNSIELSNVSTFSGKKQISEGVVLFDLLVGQYLFPISEYRINITEYNNAPLNKLFVMYDYKVPVISFAPHEAKIKEESND